MSESQRPKRAKEIPVQRTWSSAHDQVTPCISVIMWRKQIETSWNWWTVSSTFCIFINLTAELWTRQSRGREDLRVRSDVFISIFKLKGLTCYVNYLSSKQDKDYWLLMELKIHIKIKCNPMSFYAIWDFGRLCSLHGLTQSLTLLM